MNTMTMNWFPPVATPRGIKCLQLPPDDYICEVTLGTRVIIHSIDGNYRNHQVFTKYGSPLPLQLKPENVARACQGLPPNTWIDAEWSHNENMLWLCDLPFCKGTLALRQQILINLLQEALRPKRPSNVSMIPATDRNFPDYFRRWRNSASGVVIKHLGSVYPRSANPNVPFYSWHELTYDRVS